VADSPAAAAIGNSSNMDAPPVFSCKQNAAVDTLFGCKEHKQQQQQHAVQLLSITTQRNTILHCSPSGQWQSLASWATQLPEKLQATTLAVTTAAAADRIRCRTGCITGSSTRSARASSSALSSKAQRWRLSSCTAAPAAAAA
jgi:hypothetical protein